MVARSPQLVLASRLGPYDLGDLNRLLWDERRLFEYWAHAASIVLTEDFEIHAHLMRRYCRGTLQRHERLREWLRTNEGLRRRIMREIRARGPIRSRDIAGTGSVDWVSTGWTGGRNVTQMLDYLWTKGRILVVRREGLEKWWDLAERFLPDWTPRGVISPREVTRRAAQRSLRALGVATPLHITHHFTQGRYPQLPAVLADLRRRGVVIPVRVMDDGTELPGPWFVHRKDRDLLDGVERGAFEPRTTLLSPFDNLIRHRERTNQLFGTDFRMEIYVPRHLRRYGYYTMPILHGDRLIGIVDPAMDRSTGTLRVNAIHALPEAPKDRGTRAAVRAAIEDLAAFLRAERVDLPARRGGP